MMPALLANRLTVFWLFPMSENQKLLLPALAVKTCVLRLPFTGAASSPAASLRMAAMAVSTGAANHVLIPGGWIGFSGARVRQTVTQEKNSIPGGAIAWDYYLPQGLTVPPQWYALMCRRHMHEYGTTHEQMGAVAVAMRKHAQLNPAALMHGKPLSREEYMLSPMLADPYRISDCCLETDGAAAFIRTTEERRADLGITPS